MDHSQDVQQISPFPVPLQYVECDAPKPDINTTRYRLTCDRAAELLANGHNLEGVAALCNTSSKTLREWLKTTHFVALVDQKKADLREELLGNIRRAGQKDHLWTASAWYLERNKVFQGEFDPPAVKVKAQVDLAARVFHHLAPEQIIEILQET